MGASTKEAATRDTALQVRECGMTITGSWGCWAHLGCWVQLGCRAQLESLEAEANYMLLWSNLEKQEVKNKKRVSSLFPPLFLVLLMPHT